MKPPEHMAIIQEHLGLLRSEGHVKTEGHEDPSCWLRWVQTMQDAESLRTAMLQRDSMKGDSQ